MACVWSEITSIQSDPLKYENKPVRVIGRLIHYDIEKNLAQIELDQHQLTVDTSLLTVFKHRLKSLYMFMGTIHLIHEQNNSPILSAKIIRDMDALDITLYKKAMTIRSQFEKERRELLYL